MLENQQEHLVSGLQLLYKRTQHGQGWNATPSGEMRHGTISTHDILKRLGVLEQKGLNIKETSEEDLSVLQQRLIAGGADVTQKEPSFDGSLDSAPSPVIEPMRQNRMLSDPSGVDQSLPTPPNQSGYPQSAHRVPQIDSQVSPSIHSSLTWLTPVSDFNDGVDFVGQFDPPIMDSIMDTTLYPAHLYRGQIAPTATNPCLMMKDGTGYEAFQRQICYALL